VRACSVCAFGAGLPPRAPQQRPARPQDAPATSAGLFEDEEAAAFYQSLPDLRAVVPAVLLGEAEPAGGAAARGAAQPGDAEPAAAAGDGGAAAGQPGETAPPATKAASATGTPAAGVAGASRPMTRAAPARVAHFALRVADGSACLSLAYYCVA